MRRCGFGAFTDLIFLLSLCLLLFLLLLLYIICSLLFVDLLALLVCLLVRLFFRLFLCLLPCLFVCLLASLFVCLFVCLCVPCGFATVDVTSDMAARLSGIGQGCHEFRVVLFLGTVLLPFTGRLWPSEWIPP